MGFCILKEWRAFHWNISIRYKHKPLIFGRMRIEMVNKQKIKRTMIDQRFSLNSFGVPYQSSSMKFFYKFLHLRQCLNPSFGPFNMGLWFISPILEYTVGIKLASIIHFFDKRSRSRAYSHPSQCWKNSKDRNRNNRFLLKITFRCIKGKRNIVVNEFFLFWRRLQSPEN